MASAHVYALYIALLGVSVPNGQAGSLVVGRYHNQRIAIFIGKLDGLGNGLVKVQQLLHGAGVFVGVAGLVYAGTFHHEEEALAFLLAGVQEIDGLTGCLGKEVRAAVHNVSGFHGRGQDAQFFGLGAGRVVQGINHGEGFLDGLLGGGRTLFKLLLAAGGEVHDGAGGDIGPNFVRHTAVFLVGEERGRSGAVKVVRRDHAGNDTLSFHALRDIGNGALFHIHADSIVVRLLAGGISGTGGGRIRGKICGAAGGHPTQVLKIEVSKVLIVGKVSGSNLGQAGTVSNHENNVLGSVGGTVAGVRGVVGTLIRDPLDGTFHNFLGAGREAHGSSQDKNKEFFHICVKFIVRQFQWHSRCRKSDGP